MKKYPNSEYIEKAKEKIKSIEKELAKYKENEKQKEAIDKWEKILKVDEKYFKQALENYIKDYPNSPKLKEAKEELEKLTSKKEKKENKVLNFNNVKDAKDIERVIKSIKNPTQKDKQNLEDAIKKVYPSLNAKKKRQFGRSKAVIKWLGENQFEDILTEAMNQGI